MWKDIEKILRDKDLFLRIAALFFPGALYLFLRDGSHFWESSPVIIILMSLFYSFPVVFIVYLFIILDKLLSSTFAINQLKAMLEFHRQILLYIDRMGSDTKSLSNINKIINGLVKTDNESIRSNAKQIMEKLKLVLEKYGKSFKGTNGITQRELNARYEERKNLVTQDYKEPFVVVIFLTFSIFIFVLFEIFPLQNFRYYLLIYVFSQGLIALLGELIRRARLWRDKRGYSKFLKSINEDGNILTKQLKIVSDEIEQIEDHIANV